MWRHLLGWFVGRRSRDVSDDEGPGASSDREYADERDGVAVVGDRSDEPTRLAFEKADRAVAGGGGDVGGEGPTLIVDNESAGGDQQQRREAVDVLLHPPEPRAHRVFDHGERQSGDR